MPEAVEDDYFNDLSQQPSGSADDADDRRGSQEDTSNGQVPKPKRMACSLCRRRKLRCDGNKPSCGTCTRLQHDCSYSEERKKSGPKRGYVKALEARLAQVETLLKAQDDVPAPRKESNSDIQDAGNAHDKWTSGMAGEYIDYTRKTFSAGVTNSAIPSQSPQHAQMLNGLGEGTAGDAGDMGMDNTADEPFPWEMISLGLDEPLPTQDVMTELSEIYFDKIHPSLPMIHRPRFFAALNLAPHMRPPICLRYAMWCNAAAVSEKYESLQEHFYQRARKYVQQDEMKGHGESMITIAHCQTWILLSTYEFKLMFFPRAWLSSGRGSRLCHMMGLQRLDGTGLDVKQCLPPARDWAEREERRRTFWSAFCVDRYASIGTGWPMTMDERDIMSDLPCDETSFELSKPAQSISLAQALEPTGPQSLNSFAGVALMACLFGRNLTHLHRPSKEDNDGDLSGEFWKRHRTMDNILLNTALALPDSLRLPAGLNNANVVFMNMNIHTSTICLHQAAIFKADKNRLPGRVSAESKVRCITAAAEIASIMRQVCHTDISQMNPFISFCLYVAARVFVQYLKSRPKDVQVKSSLQFLLSAMHAIKRKNPLTESFLVQLDVDLEAAGLDDAAAIRARMPTTSSFTAQAAGAAPKGCSNGVPENGACQSGGRIPTYGDNGLGAFTNPSQVANTDGGNAVNRNEPQNGNIAWGQDHSTFNGNNFDLPSRQRTPSSHFAAFPTDMDISPDGGNGMLNGGSGDQYAPGPSQPFSLHQSSSRNPRNAHSPLNLSGNSEFHRNPTSSSAPSTNNVTATALNHASLQHDSIPNLDAFDPIDIDPSTFSADFDLHTTLHHGIMNHDHGYIMQDLSTGSSNTSSGLTPPSAINIAGWTPPSGGPGSGHDAGTGLTPNSNTSSSGLTPGSTVPKPNSNSHNASNRQHQHQYHTHSQSSTSPTSNANLPETVSAAAAMASAHPGILGSVQGVSDLANLSDAEWRQIMDSLPSWADGSATVSGAHPNGSGHLGQA